MIWATRANCHVDRAACAWLIERHIDAVAEFVFVNDPDEVPADARRSTCETSSLGTTVVTAASRQSCASTTSTTQFFGTSPRSCTRGTSRYHAPEARGLDVLIRGLSMKHDDDQLLAVTARLFDGLYEFKQRARLIGRDPA